MLTPLGRSETKSELSEERVAASNRPLLWVQFLDGTEWFVQIQGLVNDFVILDSGYAKVAEETTITPFITDHMQLLCNRLTREGKHMDHIGIYYGSRKATHEFKNDWFEPVQ